MLNFSDEYATIFSSTVSKMENNDKHHGFCPWCLSLNQLFKFFRRIRESGFGVGIFIGILE